MKSGYQTTEFWTAVAPAIMAVTSKDGQNQDILILCATVLTALYIISRTIVKAKVSTNESNS